MKSKQKTQLYSVRDACKILGVSYPTLKQWIYKKKIATAKTAGGHHRIPQIEIDRLLPDVPKAHSVVGRRENFRRISGRNQLVGRVLEVKTDGLMAQVRISIAGQVITSIITADAVAEMALKKGDIAAALIKSTEVMIVRP